MEYKKVYNSEEIDVVIFFLFIYCIMVYKRLEHR